MPAAGETLRRLRERAKLTLDDVCRKLGWHRSRLLRYETGERRPYLSNVVQIAAAMGLDPNCVVVECLKERYPSLARAGSTDGILLDEMVKRLETKPRRRRTGASRAEIEAQDREVGLRGLAAWTASTTGEDWSMYYPESLKKPR
ncbi:MAG: helix-turn-helix transcriptional regulator [Phycisphaerae bacterium]